MTTKDWLQKTKSEDHSLSTFITKLEPFITDLGLNSTKFESAIELGLEQRDSAVKKSLIPEKNATDKEDNY
jgi:hypothetical protein